MSYDKWKRRFDYDDERLQQAHAAWKSYSRHVTTERFDMIRLKDATDLFMIMFLVGAGFFAALDILHTPKAIAIGVCFGAAAMWSLAAKGAKI
jgi:hypothetical protein